MIDLPEGYTARPARPDDIGPMVAMLRAVDVHDFGQEDTPREEVAEVFSSSFIEPERDTLLVHDGSGELAAFAVIEATDPTHHLDRFVRVHPAHAGRGLGTALLAWGRAGALARIEPGTRTRLYAIATSTDDDGRALLEAEGGVYTRSFWHMERALDPGERESPPPAGVRFHRFADPEDWEAFHRVIESSFADHWEWSPMTLADFRTDVGGGATWDPDLTTFAEKDGAAVGVVNAEALEDALGWVVLLGILREHRGLGIGEALLRQSFADLSARGCRHVRLNVDAESTTGATRLYERAGMTVRREWMLYGQELVRD